eukprot:gene29742-12204_t
MVRPERGQCMMMDGGAVRVVDAEADNAAAAVRRLDGGAADGTVPS